MQRIFTVEELMLDDSFVGYCLDKNAVEKDFWEKEIEINTNQKTIFADARYTILLLHGKLDDNEVNRQVEKIRKLVDEKHFSVEKFPEPTSSPLVIKQYSNQKRAKNFKKSYMAYGLVALILVLTGGYLLKYTAPKATILQPQQVEVFTSSGMGERKNFQLPDGSEVVLNSNSSITYTGDFNKDQRSIILNGEAFFKVAKNPAKPFIVHSGAFSVAALGTSFYVHAANGAKDYRVDLLEGKVKLAANENKTSGQVIPETILMPGEEGAWQSSKMSFSKSLCDSADLRKWISGKLSFKNMPVEKVLELLQQWYGVDITVKHEKWNRLTLTGDYDNKPLDHVLKIICFSLSATYSYSGNEVIIE